MQGPTGAMDYKDIPEDRMIRHMSNPQMINTVVVGGKTASVWFISDFMAGMPVSIDAWR
ncbi:MAG: hypothetical protein GX846_03895, partial [Deltaproteobacteria bacterium]|nr:hypothetical protein [Deltaproteobacteria bacterium]